MGFAKLVFVICLICTCKCIKISCGFRNCQLITQFHSACNTIRKPKYHLIFNARDKQYRRNKLFSRSNTTNNHPQTYSSRMVESESSWFIRSFIRYGILNKTDSTLNCEKSDIKLEKSKCHSSLNSINDLGVTLQDSVISIKS